MARSGLGLDREREDTKSDSWFCGLVDSSNLVPDSVVSGFTSGIEVLIVLLQIGPPMGPALPTDPSRPRQLYLGL